MGTSKKKWCFLDNRKHKKGKKIHDLFYADFKMLKENSYCSSGCGGMSHKIELNWLILIDTNTKNIILRTKNPWGRTDTSRHRGTTPPSPTYKKKQQKEHFRFIGALKWTRTSRTNIGMRKAICIFVVGLNVCVTAAKTGWQDVRASRFIKNKGPRREFWFLSEKCRARI